MSRCSGTTTSRTCCPTSSTIGASSMLRRAALLAVVAVLAWGAAPAESRTQQDDVQMNLTCKVPSFKIKQPELFLNGSASLSDGMFLRFQLFRSFETLVGPQLQPAVEAVGQRTL